MSNNNINNVNDITRGAVAVLIDQIQLTKEKEEEGLTVNQAAQMLGISASQLDSMRHTKTEPLFYKEDGKILYSPSSIRAFIQANEITQHKRHNKRRLNGY